MQTQSDTIPRRLLARANGFTMAEILVTVGVIVVLAVLAVPTASLHLEKGRSSACLVKLRNLGSVMSQFRVERDQKMWNRNPVADGGEGDIAPARIFYRYGLIGSAKEMLCPAASTSAQGAWKTGGSGTADYVENVADQFVSYAVNAIAFYQNSPYMMSANPINRFWHFSGVESQTPIFMDGNHFQLNDISWRAENRFSRLSLRHHDHCNILFLDGHVKSLNRQAASKVDPFGGTNPRWMKDFGFN